jgi:hypothetical protein
MMFWLKAPSPTLSTISTKSKTGRDSRRATDSVKRKSISIKSAVCVVLLLNISMFYF